MIFATCFLTSSLDKSHLDIELFGKLIIKNHRNNFFFKIFKLAKKNCIYHTLKINIDFKSLF